MVPFPSSLLTWSELRLLVKIIVVPSNLCPVAFRCWRWLATNFLQCWNHLKWHLVAMEAETPNFWYKLLGTQTKSQSPPTTRWGDGAELTLHCWLYYHLFCAETGIWFQELPFSIFCWQISWSIPWWRYVFYSLPHVRAGSWALPHPSYPLSNFFLVFQNLFPTYSWFIEALNALNRVWINISASDTELI